MRQQTVQDASEALSNPNMTDNQKIEKLITIGFEFAGHVLNNYFHLKPYLAQKIDSFIQDKFSSHFIIGLQMRNEFLVGNDTELFFKCAQAIEAEKRSVLGNVTFKWFVSTDSSSKLELFKKKYGDRIISAEGEIGHVVEKDNAYERVIMDIELLSRCNETVLTGASSFGFISALKSQKLPYAVEGSYGLECQRFKLYSPPRRQNGAGSFK